MDRLIRAVSAVVDWNGPIQRFARSFVTGVGAGVLTVQVFHVALKAAPGGYVITLAVTVGAILGYSFRPEAKPGGYDRGVPETGPVFVPGGQQTEEEEGGTIAYH